MVFERKALAKQQAELTNLSMAEVQRDVKLGRGSTVVLSACNTGRGEIKAEGVVGLSRAVLVAGASAVVVSLWSVSRFPLSLQNRMHAIMCECLLCLYTIISYTCKHVSVCLWSLHNRTRQAVMSTHSVWCVCKISKHNLMLSPHA